MSDTSLVFNAVGRDRGVNAMLTRTAGNVRATNMSAARSTAMLGTAFAVAGSYAMALAHSAAVAAGAVFAVPAALAGLAAVVGAGRAVTMGLGEAWKTTGQAASGGGRAAGGAAAKHTIAAREIKAATLALADTQRTAREAQVAVTKARIDEAERLSDLSRSLKGARLDEQDSVANLARAEMDLALARQTGNADKIDEATRAYAQAAQSVSEAKDRTSDLAKEKADGDRKGIEGSDAVQDALKRQADAIRAVSEAQDRLAEAQDRVKESSAGAAGGGIDPAAAALAKLSPNGRAVILMLRQLAPAWHDAAMAGQQATFAGVTGDLRDLSGLYLPKAERFLIRMGGAFNTAIRETLGLAKTNAFMRDMDTLLDSTATAAGILAKAVRPIVHGIMQWVAVGSTFLPGFARDAGGLAVTFDRWSTNMRKSHKASDWISNGVTTLKSFWHIARDVAMTIVSIFKAGGDGGGTLKSLQRGAAAMRKFTESAEGQTRIKAFFDVLRGALGALAPLFKGAGDDSDVFSGAMDNLGGAVQFATDHLGWLVKWLPVIAGSYLLLQKSGVLPLGKMVFSAIQIASQWRMVSAMKAHTAAMVENTAAAGTHATATGVDTAAANAGIFARGRAIISMIGQKVALVASTIAAGAAAVAGWAVAAAEWAMASPIALIVIGLLLIAGGLYLLWTHSTTFRKIVIAAWNAVWGAIKAVWSWIKDTWPKITGYVTGAFTKAWGKVKEFWSNIKAGARASVDWVRDRFNALTDWFSKLPARIGRALRNINSFVSAPFRAAFNAISSLWNRTVGGMSFTVPSWIPGIGGQGFSMPSMPRLAKGGQITRAGSAVVGDGGEPEIVTLPAGASVTPLSQAGGQSVHLTFDVTGADRHLKAMIREMLRNGGLEVR